MFKHFHSLVKRLTTLAIQTGASGSIVATLALIVYLTDTENNISVGIAFSLGRVYALTMLHNLNSRDHVRARTAHGGNDGDTTMHFTVGDTILGVSEAGNIRGEAQEIRRSFRSAL
ncbi:hypothetical protein L218DRAFT_879312 [Marasmius fiardii PR-910]|nr:hypothetical protein L218DRAFT_879312 [Marasmius fiardii PR-910]